jgi:NADH dehydrogenase
MFAVDGGFLSILEKMARSTPIIPLIGTGATRMQPVHVSDVAEAVYLSLRNPDSAGKTYELGGPEAYTIREIYDMLLAHAGLSRRFVRFPFALASPLARVLERLPGAPLTVAQVDLLRGDSVKGTRTMGFEELGTTPRTLRDAIFRLPDSK